MNRCALSAILLPLCFLLAPTRPATAQIYVAPQLQAPAELKRVRVSVKIITDAEGRRPTVGFYHTDAQIQGAISDANLALENVGADWRLDLAEIREARALSSWYGPMDCEDKNTFENLAKSDPTRYLYRSNAINIYVFESLIGCGGYCSLPSLGEDIIIVNNRDGILNWGLGWLHEIGHYFGLLHTYQCSGLPCDSDPAVCTGAGSEERRCPDVCPDANNLMGASESLTVFNVGLSRCQLDEMARTMDIDNGIRRRVVQHPVSVANEAPIIGGCADDSNQLNVLGGGQAGAAIAVNGPSIAGDPRENEDADGGLGLGDPSADPRAGDCAEAEDVVAPEVLRIDERSEVTTGRVLGFSILFSEPIDTIQVQNGTDLQVLFGQQRVGGSIRWQKDNTELVWTSAQALPPGSYSIWLAGQDGSDFRDVAGNVLVTNLEGFFTVPFELDQTGALSVPMAPACGTGVLFPGIVSLLMTQRVQRRRHSSSKR